MKRILKNLFLLLIILPIYVNDVKAEEIDINRKGNIIINNIYGNKPITGSDIHIYKVANVNNEDKFTYLSDYTLEDSLEVTSSSDWNDLATKIKNNIDINKINYINECKTNDEGKCSLSNLSVGLYLVTASEVTIGDYQYMSNPTLIAIPNHNEMDNSLMYDLDVFLKVESKTTKIDNIDNKETTINVVPKTMDKVYTYLIIFIVSVMMIVMVSLYIKNLGKKEKNEKNN